MSKRLPAELFRDFRSTPPQYLLVSRSGRIVNAASTYEDSVRWAWGKGYQPDYSGPDDDGYSPAVRWFRADKARLHSTPPKGQLPSAHRKAPQGFAVARGQGNQTVKPCYTPSATVLAQMLKDRCGDVGPIEVGETTEIEPGKRYHTVFRVTS